MTSIRKVVVLGGNGVMGAGAGALFAGVGLSTVLLARTIEKAEIGKARAEKLAKRELPITCGTYDDLAQNLRDADFVLESVAEDLETKRGMFAAVDRVANHAIVATVSSGLSIAAMCEGRSTQFRSHFLGVHLFNPPTAITGCELIAHRETASDVIASVRELLTTCGRQVVECADTPGFAGNRLGFRVLNEVAQLADQHGVAFMDSLLGTHTGRALPPLATIDLVGWDVHKAIVDHLHTQTGDAAFALPSYVQRGIDRGHLGRKTRDKGGFYRIDAEKRQFVLDPASGDYRPRAEVAPAGKLVERMQAAAKTGDYASGLEILCTTDGLEAQILRRVLLGYISYGLGLVGEVVAAPRDIDRIMGYGFNWAPPSVLVDALGAARTIALLDEAGLAVPPAIIAAARANVAMFAEPFDSARFFAAA